MVKWLSTENLVSSRGKTVTTEVVVMKRKVIESSTITYSTFQNVEVMMFYKTVFSLHETGYAKLFCK